MTKDKYIAKFKYSVLQHVREHKNIALACKVFQISRIIYYDWLKRFIKFGYPRLHDRIKAKLRMSNQIKSDKEKIISFNITIGLRSSQLLLEGISFLKILQKKLS